MIKKDMKLLDKWFLEVMPVYVESLGGPVSTAIQEKYNKFTILGPKKDANNRTIPASERKYTELPLDTLLIELRKQFP